MTEDQAKAIIELLEQLVLRQSYTNEHLKAILACQRGEGSPIGEYRR